MPQYSQPRLALDKCHLTVAPSALRSGLEPEHFVTGVGFSQGIFGGCPPPVQTGVFMQLNAATIAVDQKTLDEGEATPCPLESAVIGVLVHNEDPTIEICLSAILSERAGDAKVRSVLVIASGCTDQTEDIVRRIADIDSRVQLIAEPRRSGKAAALNLLLRESTAPIVVSMGGDVVFTPGSLVRLLEPFKDSSVGMTGARPIPTNPRSGLVGRAVNVLWDLHHEISLHQPKLGEAVAFRRVIHEIDPNTLVDEASMENLMRSRGLELQYVPTAIVRNRGPETVRDFVAQRTRVYSGHLSLAATTGYRVSSMDKRASLLAAWRLWRRGEKARSILIAMALEAVARGRARLLHHRGRVKHNGVWHPIATSKRVVKHGHVLRSHHENVQILRSAPHAAAAARHRRPSRASMAMYRALVRSDDRVVLEAGRIKITFRSDEEGARALRNRLDAKVPGIEHV